MDRLNHNQLTSRHSRRGRRAATALLTCSLAAGLGAGLTSTAQAGALAVKGDSTLAHAKPGTGVSSVIVTLDGAMTPVRQAKIAGLHGNVTNDLAFIHSVAVRLPSSNLDRLAALPFVRHVSQDGVVRKQDAFTVNSSLYSVAYPQTGLTGQGVTVAILDSGIHQQAQDLQWPAGVQAPKAAPAPKPVPGAPVWPHGPKSGRIIDSVNYVPDQNGNVDPTKTDDLCGHGTHVAGIVAGDGAASTGKQYTQTFYGVAPVSNLVAVRVLDQNGAGTVSTVLAGIQWVIANQATDQIRVMNLSLGHPVTDSYANDPLCQAVEAAWKAGIVVVCAAGNEGRLNGANTAGLDNEGWGTAYGSIQSPANDPYVITVGAMKSTDGNRADDKIATYSGRGPTVGDATLKPDLVAPGNRVISLDVDGSTLDTEFNGSNQIPLSSYQNVGGGQQTQTSDTYFQLSGTSMASPVAAAAAALMLQQNPSLSPDTVKARLMASADKWTQPDGTADACTYGAGYVDIPAALASTVTVPAGTYALSPLLVADASGNVSIAMDPSVYGSRALWGKSSIWNTSSITDLRALWGKNTIAGSGALLDASRALWGTSTLSSSRALWGKCTLWNSNALAASRALWGCSAPGVDLTSVVITGEK